MGVFDELHTLNVVPRCLLNRKSYGLLNRSGHLGENISCPSQESKHDCPSRGFVTKNTSNELVEVFKQGPGDGITCRPQGSLLSVPRYCHEV